MKLLGWIIVPAVSGLVVAAKVLPPDAPNITLPKGFALEEVLSPELAGSVVAINFDSKGRLVLGKEFNRIVTLIPDGKGGFEQRVFTDKITTSQGLTFDGPDLIVDGIGPQGTGLYRVVDSNGDSRGESVELIAQSTGTIGDHGPHSPQWGPDGYLYWNHGNFSNVYEDKSPISPVRSYKEAVLLEGKDPRGFGDQYNGGPGGVYLRKAIPSKGAGNTPVLGANTNRDWETFAHGFRNEYDGDFNLMGELFSFDSDMEWDRDLPWYRPTNTVHVIAGYDGGYREGSDKLRWHYLDVVPPIAEEGRGSPTGVVLVESYNYPQQYWDMLLEADWSRGRVLMMPLKKSGSTYTGESSNFMYGEPLNVTDMTVGPDGNLYFALGGRSTGGGIYRVVYKGSDAMQKPAARTPIDRVLTMIKPRLPFSRELARSTKQEMGERSWGSQLTAIVRNASESPDRRARALELLQVYGPVPDEALLSGLRNDPSWEVRAASTYYLGLKPTDSARRELAARLKDSDPFVQRRAAEALLRTGIVPAMNVPIDPVADVMPLLASPDRLVRYSARKLLGQIDPNRWKEAAFTTSGYPQAPEALMAYIETYNSPDIWSSWRLARRDAELLQANPTDAQLRDLVRVIERTIIQSYGVTNIPAQASARGNQLPEGNEVLVTQESPGVPDKPAPREARQFGGGGGRGGGNLVYGQIGDALLKRFPTADSLLNRDIARVLTALGTEGATPKIAAELANPRNGREQQLFYAYILGYANEGWDEASVNQMTAFLEKAYKEGWKGGASFSNSLGMTRDAFLAKIPPTHHDWYAAASQRIEAAQPQLAVAATGRGGGAVSDEETFEELVYNPNVEQAEASRGAAAFQKAGCTGCHTFGPIGTEFGPDLTTIGQRFSRKDLATAIVFPSQTISDLYAPEVVTRKNGQKVIGIVRESGDNLEVQVAGGVSVRVPRSDVQSRAKSTTSVMPAGLMNTLNSQERRDLLKLLLAGTSALPDSAVTRINAR
jgi:putative heme-binding domain-containing protein